MQYMLLIYGEERAMEGMPEAEAAKEWQRWTDYSQWLGDKGWMKAGDALQSTSQATCVRVNDGKTITTDGPYAETKEQLGGYYLLEVENVDEAIDAAAHCPGAEYGTIELRPIMDTSAPLA